MLFGEKKQMLERGYVQKHYNEKEIFKFYAVDWVF